MQFSENAKFIAVFSIGLMLLIGTLKSPYLYPAIFTYNLLQLYTLGRSLRSTFKRKKKRSMSEKKGMTGKIIRDFPDSAVYEVQDGDGNWARVTGNTFRSFDGPRRYTYFPIQPNLGFSNKEELKSITREHYGKVFMFMTNKEVDQLDSRQVVYDPEEVKSRVERTRL